MEIHKVLLTKKELATLAFRLCETMNRKPTAEDYAAVFEWANKTRISAELLDLVESGVLEIQMHYTGTPMFRMRKLDDRTAVPEPDGGWDPTEEEVDEKLLDIFDEMESKPFSDVDERLHHASALAIARKLDQRGGEE